VVRIWSLSCSRPRRWRWWAWAWVRGAAPLFCSEGGRGRQRQGLRAAAAAILSLLTDGQARNTTGHSTGGWLLGLLESCGVHMAACAGSVPPAVPRARACFWSGVVGVWSKCFVNQTTSGSALISSRCSIGRLLCYVTPCRTLSEMRHHLLRSMCGTTRSRSVFETPTAQKSAARFIYEHRHF
jgi:hypothetical protein